MDGVNEVAWPLGLTRLCGINDATGTPLFIAQALMGTSGQEHADVSSGDQLPTSLDAGRRLGIGHRAMRAAQAIGRDLTGSENSARALFLLALLTLIVYLPAITGPFLYEDSNTFAPREMWNVIATRGPIPGLTFIVTANPFSSHLLNIYLHLMNGLILFALACGLMRESVALFLTGVFWLHPIQTESVAYITGRSELLATFGVLIVLWGLLRITSDFTSAVVMTLGGLWAFASKEATAASLFLWVPLVAIWQNKTRRMWVPLLTWVSAAGIYITRSSVLSGALGANWNWLASTDWIARQCSAMWQLVGQIIWPVGLSIEAPLNVHPDLSLFFAVMTLTASLLFLRSNWRVASLWMIAGFLPRIILAQPTGAAPEALHAHHAYGIMAGLCLSLGARCR